MTRLRSVGAIGTVLLCLAGLASCANDPPRAVTVLARGMTFVLPDRPDVPNPVIRFHPGERIRLILKNEAPGLIHDFFIPAWNVGVDPIPFGQTAEATFTVPSAIGRTEYRCRPHSELMHGFIEVVP